MNRGKADALPHYIIYSCADHRLLFIYIMEMFTKLSIKHCFTAKLK